MSDTPNPTLQKIFGTLNTKYYEGRFPNYILIFKPLVPANKEGETRPEKNQVWIASRFEQGLPENSPTRYGLDRTLKHEMVHVKLFVDGAKDWDLHNDEFTTEAKKIGAPHFCQEDYVKSHENTQEFQKHAFILEESLTSHYS